MDTNWIYAAWKSRGSEIPIESVRLALSMRDNKERRFQMRSSLAGLTIFISAVFAEVAMGASGADVCQQLVAFSKDLDGSQSREITFFTEWSAEPTKACRHDPEDAIARDFCAWLFDHTSTEFMEMNVTRVLSCLTGDQKQSRIRGTVVSMTGSVRFYEVALRGVENRIFEIEYSVRHKESPDMLRIAVSPLSKPISH